MTAISCLLRIHSGWSSRQNRAKIGCSIQAVPRVVSASARFWNRGRVCFVMLKSFVLEQLGEAVALF